MPRVAQDYGEFADFPWYGTFFQNWRSLKNFGVINLSVAQVNLSAQLMSWSLDQSKEELKKALTQ